LGKNPCQKTIKNGFGAPGVAVFFLFSVFFLLKVKRGDGLEKMFENGMGKSKHPATTCYVSRTFERLFFFHFVLV